MKLTLTVSTTSGAKPGNVVDLDDREGRTLVALGYATPHTTSKRKQKDPEATAEGNNDTEKEG